jgi:ABC-2 type transport system permease protein
MIGSDRLLRVNERGWRCGLETLLRKEHQAWWGTRLWWANALIWFAILNGMVALVMWVVPTIVPMIALNDSRLPEEQRQTLERDMQNLHDNRDTFGLQGFYQMAGLATAIGVMIVTQGAIVGEKQSGTAAWVLSCPVSRSAFVMSKFLALGAGTLIVMIGMQGIPVFAQVSLARGEPLPVLPFLGSLGLLSLHLLFYLSLTLMLGTLFDSRAPVIGIPLALFFGQSLLGGLIGTFVPGLPPFLPHSLAEQAMSLALGQPLLSYIPITVTLFSILVFVLAAIRRFAQAEF